MQIAKQRDVDSVKTALPHQSVVLQLQQAEGLLYLTLHTLSYAVL
jgi:hypothetical protein